MPLDFFLATSCCNHLVLILVQVGMGLDTVSLPCMADLEAQLAGLRCAWNSLTSPEAPAPGVQRHAKNAGECSPGRPSPQPPGPRVGTKLLPDGSQQQQQPPKRRTHEGASGHSSCRAQQARAEVTERCGPLPSSRFPDLTSAAWQEVVQAAQQPRRHGQGQQAEAAWARPDVQGTEAASGHMAGETTQSSSRSLCARQGAGDSGASLRSSHAAARLAALRQAQTSRRAVPLVQQPAAEQWEQRHGREARCVMPHLLPAAHIVVYRPRVLIQHHTAFACCWHCAAHQTCRRPSAGWDALSSGRASCPSDGRLGAGALAGAVLIRPAWEPTLRLLGCRAPPQQLARLASSSADNVVALDGSRTQKMLKTSGETGCGV